MTYSAAIVGLGQIGSIFNDDPKRKGVWTHAGAYAATSLTRLVAGADVSEDRRSRFAKRWGVERVYADYQEMLGNERPDIVSIASPTEMHHRTALDAVLAGVKAIFLEKPIASDVRQAEEILEACRERGVVLAVNHTRRWDTNYIVPGEVIKQGAIGELRAIVGYYSEMIFNMGTHLFDTMRFYGGDVEAVIGEFVSNSDAADPTLSGTISFESGAKGFIVPQGQRETLLFELDIIGSRGRLRIIDNGANAELYKFQESRNYGGYFELDKTPLPEGNPDQASKDRFLRALEDILRCIEEGGSPACSGIDGLAALEIAETMIASARNGAVRVLLRK